MFAQPVWFWFLLFAAIDAAFLTWKGIHRSDRPNAVFWGGITITALCFIMGHLIRADFRIFTMIGIVIMFVSAVVHIILRANLRAKRVVR